MLFVSVLIRGGTLSLVFRSFLPQNVPEQAAARIDTGPVFFMNFRAADGVQGLDTNLVITGDGREKVLDLASGRTIVL